MKDINFKIIHITKEKCINGNTVIEAVSVEDNIPICISVPNVFAIRSTIKDKLLEEYQRKIMKSTEKPIEAGDIL